MCVVTNRIVSVISSENLNYSIKSSQLIELVDCFSALLPLNKTILVCIGEQIWQNESAWVIRSGRPFYTSKVGWDCQWILTVNDFEKHF